MSQSRNAWLLSIKSLVCNLWIGTACTTYEVGKKYEEVTANGHESGRTEAEVVKAILVD